MNGAAAHFQGMSPRELESERQRTLRLAKRRGRSKWMPVTVVILGNELFQLVDSGQWSEEETLRELERRSADAPIESPTLSTAAVPTPAASPRSLDRGSAEWITTLKFAIHQLVNFERQKSSLSVLSQDAKLAAIARAHSEDMALNDFFEHENLAGQTAADRGNDVGYRCFKDFGSFYTEGISENTFQGWMYSSFNSRTRNYITLEGLAFRIVDAWMNSS